MGLLESPNNTDNADNSARGATAAGVRGRWNGTPCHLFGVNVSIDIKLSVGLGEDYRIECE